MCCSGELAMNLRELKGLEIAARAKIAFCNGVWIVPSQTSSGSSHVTIGSEPSCPCDDFQLRKLPCKHIIAARLVCARDHDGPEHDDKAPEIVTDAVPKKPTYKQNWPMYNEAQQTEKYRFQKLLFDLCRGLPNLKQIGAGRRWTPLADMVFACGLKVYTTVSSRRYACDLKDAHACGYLSHLMNSVTAWSCLVIDMPTLVLMNLSLF